MLSERSNRLRSLAKALSNFILFTITSSAAIGVLFIIYFIAKDAIPFFQIHGFREFFTSTKWYPSATPPSFGALAIFFGSALVTLGAIVFAVPLGVMAAICLSDILPFKVRQLIKPVIEILSMIPSVVYGFFALVVFAPLLQNLGGKLISWCIFAIATPFSIVIAFILSGTLTANLNRRFIIPAQILTMSAIGTLAIFLIAKVALKAANLTIESGTNALNVSIILGIMALPTIVSVAEDALQAVGKELREGSLALGATRSEMVLRIILPAASSGIYAAIILGVMRAVGETMVVWMASGNASQIPSPWYNFLEPVRTLTATIAGDMGEADQVTGSLRYHVLFALALCLLIFSFVANLISEWISSKSRVKLEF